MVLAVASTLESGNARLTSTQTATQAAPPCRRHHRALVFGHRTDRFGRKRCAGSARALVAATLLTACAFDFTSFAIFRALTGAAIGGEYAAINSAIDELIPARVRGLADLGINGSYWLGTALGAALSTVLLDPTIVPIDVGWRLAFGVGALLTVAVVLVRRHVPESPRWLLLHNRAKSRSEGARSSANRREHCVQLPRASGIRSRRQWDVNYVLYVGVHHYRARSVLCLTLMIAQAFFYNAIFFTRAALTASSPCRRPGGQYLSGRLANSRPLRLGRFFDTSSAPMISTYRAGVLTDRRGAVRADILTAPRSGRILGGVLRWLGGGQLGVSTVSELFPIELRAMAIAAFYAVGTAAGGLVAPALFGHLIESGERSGVFGGYALGAGLMIGAALVALKLGVAAERRPLEDISAPLSSLRD